ncbi:MAG: hypothetical protein O3C52_10100 [Proteobacteria bacterium]|nr:hypothetical protein [Pseudomonadota bacterium]MDA1033694.1 hypothetical protein [Pseudomonadota bacterium]
MTFQTGCFAGRLWHGDGFSRIPSRSSGHSFIEQEILTRSGCFARGTLAWY